MDPIHAPFLENYNSISYDFSRRVADNFFDRKMDGGILWEKIKRKKSMLQ